MFARKTLPLALALLPSALYANEHLMENVIILGSRDDAQSTAGSAAVVEPGQMDAEFITDINQAMKTVPGIYVREEDGYGLRPNIGVRGATGERSANVTLMEDGVLIAPASYADPAAYYFPTALRMHSVEILKGAPLLRYGPQTTGGVINLVSTPLPEESAGAVTVSTGTHGSEDVHAHYGTQYKQWSWLLETVQRHGDGFKEIDRSQRDSGFDIADYVVKLGWESVSGPEQSLLLKAQHSEEVSDETYLGLTDEDFARDPNRRYGLSSIDQMDNRHTGLSLTHLLAVNEQITSTATLYRNEFARDWFKLGGGGDLVTDANAGDVTAQGILDGTIDTTGLGYKHNSRKYFAQGLDVNFNLDLDAHQLQIGGRIHEDEVDRFQPVEVFDQVNGSLVFASLTLPGSGDNRVGSAEALALWAQDSWQISPRLNTNLTLRYEDVETREERFADLERTSVDRTISSNSDEWLPGASMTYELTDTWQLLAGVHKGFTPLGAGGLENEEPEISTNWELGARYRLGETFAEVVGFYSDFSSKVENCSVGTPCSNGETSGSFNTGEAIISGLEVQWGARYTLGQWLVPVDLSYTYTQAEISADNALSGVLDGDTLKDVPEQVVSLRVGLESSRGWRNYLTAKYVDETCVTVGCNRTDNPLGQTDSLFVIDAVSRYRINQAAEVFVKIENLLDEQNIVSRDPDGARPNKPLSAAVGLKLSF